MKDLKFLSLYLFLSIIGLQTSAQENILDQLKEIAIIDQKIMMPMCDGIKLATDIFRPKTNEPVPIIFVKTPYNFNSWHDGEMRTRTYRAAYDAVKRGYAYVIQNERGRYFSQGEWEILGAPVTDGYDAFSWLEEQSWSNGKIITTGCSSTAEWQMGMAALDHPAHTAMIPAGYGAGVGRVGRFYEQGNWYRGGAQQMLFTSWLYWVQNDRIRPTFPDDATREELIRVSKSFDLAPRRPQVDWKEAFWHLPVEDIIRNVDGPVGAYEKMITRLPDDPEWFQGGLYHDNMDFGVPSLWICSWYDVSIGPNLELFNHVRQNASDPEVRENQYVIISPSTHCGYNRVSENTVVGEREIGDARLNFDSLTNGWMDYWLKDENSTFLEELPRVQYFTMGLNQWQTSDTWPPEGMKMKTWYLASEGKANTLNGDGQLTNKPGKNDLLDVFTYDPADPVPSYGGNVCCTGGAIQPGSFDQSEIEKREDILVYTTEPLKKGVEVSGFIEATLYVSSDAKDTDFTIKMIDVYPDGRAYNLDETIFRARFREGFEREVFMEEGQVYKIEMSPMSTSNYFKKGHRIRIEVSSSNFPRFERNLNTGGRNYDETEGVVATNKIHHSVKYPSQVRLPVI
ncbi:MAG: CocE/NonD family hydrolase, partial [Bacteroidales bacterium]